MSTGLASLQPTYIGHVATTRDALILFEACLSGYRHHVPRRPHDRERAHLIRSGSVFIYEENASGIKRWTDGVPWSPSRILGNFLVYRELLKPFPPGEKKRATKRAKRVAKPGEPYPRQSDDASTAGSTALSPASPSTSTSVAAPAAPGTATTPTPTPTPTPAPATAGASASASATPSGTASVGAGASTASTPTTFRPGETFDREMERSLIGSLVDSYGFREGGLVKKTMSVTINGVHHHLVSYYKVEDVINHTFETPSQNESLRILKPRAELTHRQNFRSPLDEFDEGFGPELDGQRHPYDYGDRGPMDRRPGMPPHAYPHGPGPHPAGMGYSGVEHLPYATGAPPHLAHPQYGMHAPPGAQQPPSSQPYYGAANVQPVIKTEDYGTYGQASPYPPRYDALNQSVDPAAAAAVAGAPDRGSHHAQAVPYAQEHIRQRPMNGAENSNGVEHRAPSEAYPRAYGTPVSRPEGAPGQYPMQDAARWQQQQQQQQQQQHHAPHAGQQRMENAPGFAPSSEQQQQQQQQQQRGNYWPMSGNVPVHQGQYPNSSTVPHPTWHHPAGV